MKPRNTILAALIAGFTVPVLSADTSDAPAAPAAVPDTTQFAPPGPRGGPRWMTPEQRDKLRAMTPEERQKFFQERQANCPRGMGGGPVLTTEQRDKLRAMTPQERRAYMLELRGQQAPTPPATK